MVVCFVGGSFIVVDVKVFFDVYFEVFVLLVGDVYEL